MMTPKEKAEELYNKFNDHSFANWDDEEGWDDSSNVYNTKKCALICVDEIMDFQPWDVYTFEKGKKADEYWNEVKEEIDKI